MQQDQGIQGSTYLVFNTFMTVAYIYVFGYQFNAGDLAEHLPQVYQHFDSELYSGDFFLTYYHQTFTIRHYWVMLVSGLSYFLSIEWVCFILHAGCVFLTFQAWILISKHFSKSTIAPYVSIILIFFVLKNFTLGGNQLLGIAFVSSIPAEMLASWAIYYFLQKKYLLSPILCGLSVLFQALVGIHIAMILGCILLLNKSSFKESILFGTVFILSATPMLLPLLNKYLLVSDQYDTALYYKILFEYRAFLHYLPSLFPKTDYLKFTLLIVSSIILYISFIDHEKFVFKFVLLIFSIVLIYTIAIESFGILSIGKLQFFKMTTWVSAFCCLIFANFIAKKLNTFLDFRIPFFKINVTGYVLSSIILLAITNSNLIPDFIPKRVYTIGNFKPNALQIVHEWIRLNTPKDALFLAPPDDESFACEAQRSMPVNYKAVVHEPFYMIEWLNRMQQYYQVDTALLKEQKLIEQAKYQYANLLKYPDNHLCQYRLDNILESNITDKLGEKVFTYENWVVTRISH